MAVRQSIALLGIDQLNATALRAIADELGGLRLIAYHDFPALLADADSLGAFIVSPQFFIAHIDFFLPRKTHCALLFSERKVSPMDSSPVKAIFADSSDEEIMNILNQITELSEKENQKNGELSQRETEVLRLLASGLTNKEIADRLNISVNTALTHRKNISAKLGIRSVSGLSLYAMMHGLL